MSLILYPKESYEICGCLYEVHKELGSGFLEAVYQEALEREFIENNIPYEREVRLQVLYKGVPLKKEYFADFVCFGKIIVELKTVNAIEDVHKCQVKNYLKATGYELGIIANFSTPSLETYRVCNSKNLLSK